MLDRFAAFLSYAHFDNRDEGITRLGAALSDEVQGRIGEPFRIFRDEPDIGWGEVWRDRLERELGQVTFLIAILTPSYFTSEQCVAEFNAFLGYERRAGRNDLVLPLYYIDVGFLERRGEAGDAPRAAIREAFRVQHVDWRSLRGRRLGAGPVRMELQQLGARLVAAIERAELRAPDREPTELAPELPVPDSHAVTPPRGSGESSPVIPPDPPVARASADVVTERDVPVVPQIPVQWLAPILRVRHSDAPVVDVAFSSDGRRLASASLDRTVKVLTFEDRTKLTLPHEHPVTRVAFSARGTLATASQDRIIRLHDVPERDPRQLKHESVTLNWLENWSFSPDGSLLAVAVPTGTSRVWDTDTADDAFMLAQPENVWGVAFSHNGRLLATAGFDKTARICNTDTGEEDDKFIFDEYLRAVLYRPPDSKMLATVTNGGTACVFRAANEWQETSVDHPGGITDAAFSPDGRLFATAGQDGIVTVVDLEARETDRFSLEGGVAALAFSSDSRLLAGASGETIVIWDVEDIQQLATLANIGAVLAMTFSPRGRLLATAGNDGAARIWDLADAGPCHG
jgi:WD40 repeat protein